MLCLDVTSFWMLTVACRGGLLRNIFAGGSTVCCPAFDPGLFWSVVEDIGPTWYYASPTMHSLILATAPGSHKGRFRLICNAAGGLLPSLALQLQTEFKCTVLPSYGMTE
jgi:acyl-CoA synthetase (AMP-forming)/AMP-acid ligase II